MTLQQIGKWTTGVLWALCLGAILLVLYGTGSVQQISLEPVNLAQLIPDSQSEAAHPHWTSLAAPIVSGDTGELRASDLSAPLLFPGKTAFIDYFKNRYAEAELLESYREALAKAGAGVGNPAVWVYPQNGTGKSKDFSGSYKLRLRFDVKPVPK